MAKSTVGLGTANQGDGDPIRTAFSKLNDNHTELYALLGDGNTLSVTGDVALTGGAATIQADSVENTMLANIARGSVKVGGTSNAPTDLDAKGDGKILIGDGTDIASVSVSGDIAITNAGATTIQAGAVENSMLADNAVDHDELAARYTTEVTKTDTAGTGGSAITLNWATGSIFHFSSSLTGAIELKFDNYKVSQVVDIYGLTGSQTITLNSTASGTEVFNKVGTTDYDGSETNHIQVICLDDSASTPVFHYTINKVTSDDTP
ncbi:MAG: hypothetical protein GOVbin150_32 [Prokaryotic dsDNA virus sp.]|nr:MAG: hypothetical protein GOVbin150_32 [Prokaryotic dsDNA virus sp.]|tara:strand:- start:437 stop:1228 length:792 start_codon:yes stop_codon:yes gene_type:complete